MPPIVLDGLTGITTPGLTNTGTETLVNLTTTGNTTLGDASTDTLNVGNGGLIKDASGNVGVGITPTTKFHVSSASNTFATVESTNGAAYWQMIGNNATNASYNTLISKYGATTDWSISGGNGTSGTMVFSANGSERARFNTTGALVFAGGTTSANGIGITFPATQSASTDANTLDDYEEGTWTPTLSFDVGQVGNFTYSTQTGFYTIIGNTAVIYFTITCTAIPSAGGILKISSPFSAGGTTTKGFVSTVSELTFTSRNLGAGGTQVSITNYGAVLAPVILGSGRAYADVVDKSALTSGFGISGGVIIKL